MAVANANRFQLFALDSETGARLPIGEAQSASIDISNALIDVTTKSSNSWMEKIPGQKSFTVSVDGLLDVTTSTTEQTPIALTDFLIADTQLYFSIGVTATAGTLTTGDVVYSGSGFLSSANQSGGTDDAPTYSITLEGTAELTKVTTP